MGVSTKGGSPSRNPFVPFELLNSKNHTLNNSMFDAPPTNCAPTRICGWSACE